MKKFIATISFLLYLGMTTGVVVNFHYCMNTLASADVFGREAKVCGKCGMDVDSSMGCCRDEVKVIKMEDDHQPAVSLMLAIQAPAIVPTDYSDYFSAFIPEPLPKGSLNNHSPPLLSEQDTYLQNRVFRL